MQTFQIDLFGNEQDVSGPKKPVTMQRLYGCKPGSKCGNCRHCYREMKGRRTLYQCALWNNVRSEAGYISKNDEACQKYEFGRVFQ